MREINDDNEADGHENNRDGQVGDKGIGRLTGGQSKGIDSVSSASQARNS